ncbi:hypothetical protein Barb4_00040 [Bacteroidales bacterium Barb4]|nr:hypothetical protein Barb4_00040 [Bacteroidales bacterium Barb4]
MTGIDNEKYPNYSGKQQTNKNSDYEVNRLSLAEEAGRRRGGRRNEEASALLSGEAGTDEIKRGNFEAVAERQEQTLENWAKKEGVWFDIDRIREQPFIGRGEEASVYEAGDPAYVNKVMFYQVFSDTPLSFLDNRISLHNYLFPDTAYELLGFGRTQRGFAFVLKQPHINASFFNRAASSEFVDEMKKTGLEAMDENTYFNEDYIISDLHAGNVMKDGDGNLYFIDTVPVLNTPDEGYGGTREYGEQERMVSDKANVKISLEKPALRLNLC